MKVTVEQLGTSYRAELDLRECGAVLRHGFMTVALLTAEQYEAVDNGALLLVGDDITIEKHGDVQATVREQAARHVAESSGRLLDRAVLAFIQQQGQASGNEIAIHLWQDNNINTDAAALLASKSLTRLAYAQKIELADDAESWRVSQ